MGSVVCPGDAISYSCVIESYSPELELAWRLTAPGSAPVAVTYTSASSVNVSSSLGMNITAIFYGYDESVGANGLRSVESVLMLTVPCNVSENEMMLECSFTNFSIESQQQLFDAPSEYNRMHE